MSDATAVTAALRSGHDTLASLVSELSDEDLARPTAASEWDVSQVLSHMGSGAEIMRATVRASADGEPGPGMDFNRGVWDRWDALGRRERADGYPASTEALLDLFDSLAGDDDLRIDLAFLPAPVDLATTETTWLVEAALHSWDVRAGLDPAAAVAPDAVPLILPTIAYMTGLLGKPEALDGKRAAIAVTTTGPDSRFVLNLGQQISVADAPGTPGEPDGTLSLPAEAWVRLATGRLRPAYTPASVTATGAADLDLLRAVFPGF